MYTIEPLVTSVFHSNLRTHCSDNTLNISVLSDTRFEVLEIETRSLVVVRASSVALLGIV